MTRPQPTAATDAAGEHDEITSVEQLRQVVEPPHELMVDKGIDRVDAASATFLAQATFYLLATRGADGSLDLSPRGDAPGTAQILDDGKRLALPDRGGNRRVDSMRNILEGSGVGMLFLVPGVEHSLRINGRARLVTTPWLLDRMAAVGPAPDLALLVEVDELFVHCGRALSRSVLWDPANWPADPVPSAGELFKSQLATKTP